MGWRRYAPAVETALQSLEETDLGGQLARWARETNQRIRFSNLLGGPGGAAWFLSIYFPRSMMAYLEPDRLAHELVHRRQGANLFGCLEYEREAYLIQYRCRLEMNVYQAAREETERVISLLEAGGEAAYEWIKTQGDYYKTFPIHPPRIWEVTKWWPQVRYGLAQLLPRKKV